MKRSVCTILIAFLAFLHVNAMIPQGDSIRISLLTCEAGEEIYSLFGHTGIRVCYPRLGIDVVYNYGVFDFRSQNFILRFALGETDYMLGVYDYEDFIYGYKHLHRNVEEQDLNLSLAEKDRLFSQLYENSKPENRVYRYNFFFDNCSTRPRDQIERAAQGKLHYAEDLTSYSPSPFDAHRNESFRDIIRFYSQESPWYELGMDFCLGSLADRPMTLREKMFVPFYLRECMTTAMLTDSLGEKRPLIGQSRWIVKATPIKAENHYPSPMVVFWTMFAVILAVSLYEWRKKKLFWGIDALLFTAAGLSGIILFILNFFSAHPCVSGNYTLIALHPLHLLAVPYIIVAARKRIPSYYMLANGIVLTFFIILFKVIPQDFNPALLPLACILYVRSWLHVLATIKLRKRQ